jgi:His-Xaa-Ser system protein HxsD
MPSPRPSPARPRGRAAEARLRLPPRLVALDDVYGACYVLLARAFIRLEDDDGAVVVRLKPREPGVAAESLADELASELVNQRVRRQLARQHTRLREMIVGRALFGAGVESLPEVEAAPALAGGADWMSDPLGIAVPWEERYVGAPPAAAPPADAPPVAEPPADAPSVAEPPAAPAPPDAPPGPDGDAGTR